jgi:serine/threonine protein kinase
MSEPPNRRSRLEGEPSACAEEILDRFETQWNHLPPPTIDDFLPPPDSPERWRVLRELVLIDLERRLGAGEPARVETYLEQFPELKATLSLVLNLVLREYELRCQKEMALTPEEYLNRFPELGPELVARFGPVTNPTTIQFPPTGDGAGEGLSEESGYELLGELGRGGLGVVFLARDRRSGGEVAVKVLRPELRTEPQAVRLFLKEAGHMARLDHPSIVPVQGVRETTGGPAYVMPYFRRGSVLGLLAERRPLSPEVILPLVRQVAEALRFAHERGLIHRDVKPANVLLGDDGRACLADFGLVRSLYNDSLLDVRRVQCEGTAPYLSPAVAAGQAEDTRCDVYSWGALLYELLTGQPPYSGRDAASVVGQVLTGPPPPIRELNPTAPLGLVRVAEGAMARSLRDRYAQMGDVIADLDRIAAGREPLGPHGRPAPSHSRLPLIVGTAAILVVLLLGLALPGWLRHPEAGGATATAPDAGELKVSAFRVDHFRGEHLGVFGKPSRAARAGDGVRVTAELTRPAACYLISFTPQGTSHLCYPADPDTPPPPTRLVRYPTDPAAKPALVDGEDGLQMFALAVKQDLPPFRTWENQVGPLLWAKVSAQEGWRYDGRQYFTLDGRLRGGDDRLDDLPGPLDAERRLLEQRGGFEVVQLIAFPVKPKSSSPAIP